MKSWNAEFMSTSCDAELRSAASSDKIVIPSCFWCSVHNHTIFPDGRRHLANINHTLHGCKLSVLTTPESHRAIKISRDGESGSSVRLRMLTCMHRRMSSLWGGRRFCPKNCMKNYQNARILHDNCPKNLVGLPLRSYAYACTVS